MKEALEDFVSSAKFDSRLDSITNEDIAELLGRIETPKCEHSINIDCSILQADYQFRGSSWKCSPKSHQNIPDVDDFI